MHVMLLTCALLTTLITICRSHLFARVRDFEKGEGFLIQPLNGLGEDEGKALAEDVNNVHLLPAQNSEVSLNDEKNQRKIEDYSLTTQGVFFAQAPPPKSKKRKSENSASANASASAAKIDTKKRKVAGKTKKDQSKKKNPRAAKNSGKNTRAAKNSGKNSGKKSGGKKSGGKRSGGKKSGGKKSGGKKSGKTSKTSGKSTGKGKNAGKSKRKKQPLDKVSTTDSENASVSTAFTLGSVLASFANPRGKNARI